MKHNKLLMILAAVLAVTFCMPALADGMLALVPASVPTATPAVTAEPSSTPAPSPAPTQTPICSSPTPTVTPTPTPEATTEPEPAATPAGMPLGYEDQLVLAGMEEQADDAGFANAAAEGSHYADFTFGGVQTMNGIYSTVSLYAYVPEYAVPVSGVLRFSYAASDLILTDYSSLTFYMNGQPFESRAVLHRENEGQIVWYITVPSDLLTTGYNLLEIVGYVRMTNDEGCTDDFNGGNWVKIADTTCLRIGYEMKEDTTNLGLFPFPFITLNDATAKNAAVCVSDAAVNGELTAAVNLLCDLGTELSTCNDIVLARISQNDRPNVVYFGLADNTPDELLAMLEEPIPANGAVLQRVSAEGREYLLCVARDDAALLEAARFLADADRVKQASGSCIVVYSYESQSYIEAANASSLALDGVYRLTDVLGKGATFTGPFEQSVVMYLPVADDYALSSEARFTFNIRYSANLDFTRSLMTVYWGSDIPLYSTRLSEEHAAGQTISFAPPADAIGTNYTYVTVVFDLEMQDLVCTERDMNTPWAYIAGDSAFYLPSGSNRTLSLKNLPAPFQSGSTMNDVVFILPDEPTAGELTLTARTAGLLGSGSIPYGKASVIRAADFDANDADHNLVVIGLGRNNAMFRSLNEHLSFRYNDTFSGVSSNDRLIISEDYASEVGSIQLIASPYSADRAVLVLTAPQSNGLTAVTERISTAVNRWSLAKDTVLVDSHGRVSSYQFTVSTAAVSAAGDEKPTIMTVIAENREPMTLLIIGLACMVLTLLGVVLVLIRVRKHNHSRS